jgi:Short C-terminal domain
MIRRRRPLLRAAAVAGGAYIAGKKTANRQTEAQQADAAQEARISQLEQQQPERPAASSVSDQLSQITRLHDQGILTDEEFSAAKAKVLGI